VKSRPLTSDLSLSRVGFGCWPLGGGPWGHIDDREAREAIFAALDLGIDWFDTAPIYGHGAADERLRRVLGPRIRDVVVATKVGVRLDAETDHAESDLAPAHLRSDCEASLKRLGLERIDHLQVHWPCERGTPIAETLGALARLRDEGKVRAFGLCNYDAKSFAQALEVEPSIASLQSPLSLIRREAEDELLPLVERKGVAFLAYETLGRGLLTGKYTAPPTFPDEDLRSHDPRFRGSRFLSIAALARVLVAVGEEIGASAAAVATGWALSRPGVTHAIVGARSAAQIREAALSPRLAGEPKLWGAVERAFTSAQR
jgi:aryl-alcohol dehydrogenase-like predicted oxidoreductase